MKSEPLTPIHPSHIFLADVHLGSATIPTSEVQTSLLTLFQWAKKHSASVFILGDLFDYWMEFTQKNITPESRLKSKASIPSFGQEIVAALAAYNSSDNAIHYVLGNHDYWDDGLFEQLGCHTSPEGFYISLDEHKIALLHGDGLPSTRTKTNVARLNHLERPLLHTILRSKTFLYLFRKLFTPTTAWNIMRLFSSYNRNKKDQPVEIMDTKLTRFINTTDVDVVIAGHDHIARKVKTTKGHYYNTGPFFNNMQLLVYSSGNFFHANWNAKNQAFITTEPISYTV